MDDLAAIAIHPEILTMFIKFLLAKIDATVINAFSPSFLRFFMKNHPIISSHKRCIWANSKSPLMIAYHDTEWGLPVHNDKKHFEFLILEGAQAGLSWDAILKRREGFRAAFANFDPEVVAKYDAEKEAQLMGCSDIIRNKLKIRSTVINANHFIEIQKEFGSFDRYIWQFTGGKSIHNRWNSHEEIPCVSKESKEISNDLKKRGFKFIGPTIIYAYMQAVGIVNDHTTDCFRYSEILGSKTEECFC